MAMSAVELAIHRKSTDHFISSDRTDIVLTTRGTESMVNGTKSFSSGVERPEQSFKVIWMGENGIIRQLTGDGGVRRFDFILVGSHDATVDIGDYWEVDGQENRIEYVYPFNGYEVKAGGVSNGPKPAGA
jgi:hypothetical protein